MGHFDEVCFLCGVSPIPPSELSPDPEGTAEILAHELVENFPGILEDVDGDTKSEEDLQAFLFGIIQELEPADLPICGEAFCACIAVGYFDDDGNVPHEDVDDPVIKRKIPDGRFVTTRLVSDSHCGEFCYEVVTKTSDTGVVADEEERVTRTSAYWQRGFGNFFLSKCCYRYLEAWIDRARLPPMWDGRELSFAGELYEVINSRETGRGEYGYLFDGWLEWLEPGGAERTLEQTQTSLATAPVYPVATAEGLRNGFDRKKLMECIYDDYGLWMFATPHSWPRATGPDDLVELSVLGFDVPPRTVETVSTIGTLARFSPEILVQIFGWLPSLATYLGLMVVSKQMHDLISDAEFTSMVLREMLEPDPARAMFWIHPIKQQPEESGEFKEAVKSWVPASPTLQNQDLSAPGFPFIQFIHAVYSEDSTRNRRRLWNNTKRLEAVWVDYRVNGWKVDRFGVPYPEQ